MDGHSRVPHNEPSIRSRPQALEQESVRYEIVAALVPAPWTTKEVTPEPRCGSRAQSKAISGVTMARFLIVEARFYEHLNDMLIAGAREALENAGHQVEILTVPGALEVPGAIASAAESGRYEGFVALGVVIRGETFHFEIVAGESARGIMALTMDGLAVGNGILTVENEAQAIVRADPAQLNKGAGAAEAALALLAIREKFA
jgi:6,7-dimethyl-8-ribityllumazine synthase